MTYSSCAGSPPNDLKNRESVTIVRQAWGNAGPAGKSPVSLKRTPVVAGHGTTRPEINISGNQLLVAFVVACCLAGPLVWSFMRYWLFAP